jgi:hypothetical protein
MVMVVLGGLGALEQRLRRIRRTVNATIRVRPGTPPEEIEAVLRGLGVRVVARAIFDHPRDRTLEMKLAGPARQFEEARAQLAKRDDVHLFELE